MRILIVAFAVFLAQHSAVHAESDNRSGAVFREACKAVVTAPKDTFLEGVCVGMVLGIAGVARELPMEFRACLPPNAERRRTLQTIVSYLEAHEDKLAERFGTLIVRALHDGFPCN
jgi:hypothetical protein